MLDTVAAEIGRGWTAPASSLTIGSLAALAVSGPTAIMLGFLGMEPGALVAVAAVVQLPATSWIAGRHARHADH